MTNLGRAEQRADETRTVTIAAYGPYTGSPGSSGKAAHTVAVTEGDDTYSLPSYAPTVGGYYAWEVTATSWRSSMTSVVRRETTDEPRPAWPSG